MPISGLGARGNNAVNSRTMRSAKKTHWNRSHIELPTPSAVTVCSHLRSKFIGHLLAIK